MTDPRRVEDFDTDLPPDRIRAARLAHARSVASLAYLDAFPTFLHLRQLTEYLQGRAMMAPDEEPLGGWFLMRALSDPSVTTVSPNVDTLYGAAHLLLGRQGPVVLEVPPIADRYWSVAAHDAGFGVFAVFSARTVGQGGGAFLLVPPGWQGERPEGITTVHESPTSAVCLLQRIYCRSVAEVPDLHAVQDAITVTSLDRWRRGEPGTDPVDTADWRLEGVRLTTDPLDLFRLTARFRADDPVRPDDTALQHLFRSVGVGWGATPPGDADVLDALRAGARDAQHLVDAELSGPRTGNGWRLPDPAAGRLDAPLVDRAVTQATQMGALPLEEALYFFAYVDGAGRTLDGRASYDLRFEAGALPAHAPLGFWSVTMYGDDALLVDNELDRYLIRPDTDGLRFGADGSLTLRLSHERPSDPANWLPAPAGPFNLGLRVYLADPGVVDGTWLPPAVTPVT